MNQSFKKILIASDSFKGTLSSVEVGNFFKDIFPNSKVISISDGGEGFVESILINNSNYKKLQIKTFDDMMKPISIIVAIKDSKAYMDVSSIIALNNYPNISAKLKTSYGVGLVIKILIQKYKLKEINIGLGGSSTSDAGFGASIALGFKYYDKYNKEIFTFSDIQYIHKIIRPIINSTIIGYSDVKNKLNGINGAASVFGRQKYMNKREVETNKRLIEKYSKNFQGKNDLKKSSGAAGGLGFFILSHLNGTIFSGVEKIMHMVNIKLVSLNYDYVVTGEGKFDDQSLMGKVPIEISKNVKIPIILIAGDIDASIQTLQKYFFFWVRLREGNEPIKETIQNTTARMNKAVYNIKKFIDLQQ